MLKGVPVLTQWLTNPTGNHEVVGSIPGLAQWVIAMSGGVGHRRSSDLVLLWLWHRLAATALIRPLAWEASICRRSGSRKGKKTKKKRERERDLMLKILGSY